MARHLVFEKQESTLPVGNYNVRLESHEEKAGAKGPYEAMTFVVDDGDYAGRKLFTNLSYSEKAQFKLIEFLQAMGEDVPDAADIDKDSGFEFDFDPDNYIDSVCLAQVEIENYTTKDGKPALRNTITKLSAA